MTVGEIAASAGGILETIGTVFKPVVDVFMVVWGYLFSIMMSLPKELWILFGLLFFGFTIYQFYEHAGTSWVTSTLITILLFFVILTGVGIAMDVDVWGFALRIIT